MGILLWIVCGSLVGLISVRILKTETHHGVGISMLTGMIGALIGGWLMSILGNTGGIIAFNPFSFSAAVIGAAALLAGPQAIHRFKLRHA